MEDMPVPVSTIKHRECMNSFKQTDINDECFVSSRSGRREESDGGLSKCGYVACFAVNECGHVGAGRANAESRDREIDR